MVSDGTDVNEQLIIIGDRSVGAASAVLSSFKRQVQKYGFRGEFYIDTEKLLSQQQATLLVGANLYLCNEQSTISIANNPSYVTLEFKTLEVVQVVESTLQLVLLMVVEEMNKEMNKIMNYQVDK